MKGLHAHHPRDCLFYLRDESIEFLQKLLEVCVSDCMKGAIFTLCLLKTNILDERVCSTETSGTALTPNTPPLTAWPHGEWADSPRWLRLPSLRGRMGSERIQRASHRIWKFQLSPWTWSLFAYLLHPPPKQGKGTVFGDQRIVVLVSVPQTMIITNVRL